MENRLVERHPEILVNRSESGIQRLRVYTEPEVEECCEDTRVKDIIENMGLKYKEITNLEFLNHTNSEEGTCSHCLLLKKVETLENEIQHMSREIGLKQEVLKVKKGQNNELKNVVTKLEDNFGGSSQNETILESPEKSCSCSHSCAVM